MANVAATIARDGIWVRPHLVPLGVVHPPHQLLDRRLLVAPRPIVDNQLEPHRYQFKRRTATVRERTHLAAIRHRTMQAFQTRMSLP